VEERSPSIAVEIRDYVRLNIARVTCGQNRDRIYQSVLVDACSSNLAENDRSNDRFVIGLDISRGFNETL